MFKVFAYVEEIQNNLLQNIRFIMKVSDLKKKYTKDSMGSSRYILALERTLILSLFMLFPLKNVSIT